MRIVFPAEAGTQFFGAAKPLNAGTCFSSLSRISGGRLGWGRFGLANHATLRFKNCSPRDKPVAAPGPSVTSFAPPRTSKQKKAKRGSRLQALLIRRAQRMRCETPGSSHCSGPAGFPSLHSFAGQLPERASLRQLASESPRRNCASLALQNGFVRVRLRHRARTAKSCNCSTDSHTKARYPFAYRRKTFRTVATRPNNIPTILLEGMRFLYGC